MFKDITPLLADPAAFAGTIAELAAGHDQIDKVAGIEARGFILAAPVACRLGVGFVPVRKLGKLPGPTHSQTYELEYGSAAVEVKTDAFAPGDRVLLIDDVLATGGTAAATVALIKRCGAEVSSLSVMVGSAMDVEVFALLRGTVGYRSLVDVTSGVSKENQKLRHVTKYTRN